MPSHFASALALVLNRMETIVFPAKKERQDCQWGWGLVTLCPLLTPLLTTDSHRLSRQSAPQPRTHHPFPLHLMAPLYTYRPQTFGLVFAIANVPSGKMKYTSPKYPYKAEVQNVTAWWEPREGAVAAARLPVVSPRLCILQEVGTGEKYNQKQCQEARDSAAL